MICIGIDLGTTNSLAAIWRNQKVEIIPNAISELMTPSAISLSNEEKLSLAKRLKIV